MIREPCHRNPLVRDNLVMASRAAEGFGVPRSRSAGSLMNPTAGHTTRPFTNFLSLEGEVGGYNRSIARDRGTNAWFAETQVRTAGAVLEQEGDLAFSRVRAPLFHSADDPHVFMPEERDRMDCYESIDYSEPQSLTFKTQMMQRRCDRRWLKWVLFVTIGVAVGMWSVLLYQTLDFLANLKLHTVDEVISDVQHASLSASDSARPVTRNSQGISWRAIFCGYGVHTLWSVVAALLSSLCCVVMPSAAGSGIPDVMAYLNGIMFPRIFNVRNLVVKTLSCVLAVSAGMPVGTEGPIIHIGSLIGAGLPTGRSRSLHCSATSLLQSFRNAKDERDFISAGAACGLTCAFSSPLGGMLFVLEEMATFFPARLAWMVLVSCLSCMCVTQLINTYLTGWRGADGIDALALFSFRDAAIAVFYLETVPTNNVPLNWFTFFPTAVLAVVAGLLAVLYTLSSIRFSRWRSRRLSSRVVMRILEPGVFAFLYGTLSYFLPLAFPCVEAPPVVVEQRQQLGVELFSAFCSDPKTQFHPLATLMMTSPYNLIRLLFSRNTRFLVPLSSLLVHLGVYGLGCSYAGGLFISCGTVIPTLLIGTVVGRAVGEALPDAGWADPGVLALMGAAAYFSGISRLTFSLTVIMMEVTSDLTHVSCLMFGVVVAKGIADRLCHSFYHASLELKAAPFLEAQTSIHQLDTYSVKDIMSSPPVTLDTIESVLRVVELLHTTTHNAFMVVSPTNGAFVGLVSRRQLQLLLWVIVLREVENVDEEELSGIRTGPPPRGAAGYAAWLAQQPHLTHEALAQVKEYVFWHRLPAIPPSRLFQSVEVLQSLMDLTPYVDTSPYYVQEVACISRAYYIFRHLGLRHLPVLNRHQNVVGVLTRTNFVGDRLSEKMKAAEARELARNGLRRIPRG